MKYKPGDEVFIKAEITDICPESERQYFVQPNIYSINWVSEEWLCPTDKTYSQGLSDAWELADKLNNMPLTDIIELFGIDIAREEVFKEFSPEEALAKIEAYEREKEIKVGDVVNIFHNGSNGVVVRINESGGFNVVLENGLFYADCVRGDLTKTNKHIDIEGLLRQIGE